MAVAVADQEQPDWSSLPSDLLELIGQRSRDAVTGVTAFRSVCRAWRAAVGPSPRLLLPRASPTTDSESSSDHTLLFPLSHGWSVVFDARDASCHLSHLATGATAALPNLNAVREGRGTTDITRHRYRDLETARRSGWMFPTYLAFTDRLHFAVHVPPVDAPAPEGMTIMMYHMMLGRTGVLFCRPGDTAWTKVEKPCPRGYGFFDFAYHDGRMFGMDIDGKMVVYDAATLNVLHLAVQPPPATRNFITKMYTDAAREEESDYVHLVALPSKMVLVRTSVKSNRPVAFTIFELGSTAHGLAWLKVMDAGNYELFLDRYHTTFRENGANDGTRIYYVHDANKLQVRRGAHAKISWVAYAYCYTVQDNKLECVYETTADSLEYSTKPSWFVP